MGITRSGMCGGVEGNERGELNYAKCIQEKIDEQLEGGDGDADLRSLA